MGLEDELRKWVQASDTKKKESDLLTFSGHNNEGDLYREAAEYNRNRQAVYDKLINLKLPEIFLMVQQHAERVYGSYDGQGSGTPRIQDSIEAGNFQIHAYAGSVTHTSQIINHHEGVT